MSVLCKKGYQLTQLPDEGLKTSNSKKVHKTCHDMFEQFLGSSDLTSGLTGELNAKYRNNFPPFILHYLGALMWLSSRVLPSPTTTQDIKLAT